MNNMKDPHFCTPSIPPPLIYFAPHIQNLKALPLDSVLSVGVGVKRECVEHKLAPVITLPSTSNILM